MRSHVRLLAVGTVVIVCVVVAAALLFWPHDQPSTFVGWAATPMGAASSHDRAGRACERLAHHVSESGQWAAVLVDARGPYTVIVLRNGLTELSCFARPSSAQVLDKWSYEKALPTIARDGLVVTSRASGRLTSHGPWRTEVIGRVGNGVRRLTVIRSDGTHVTATVAGGRFLAWWPGHSKAAAFRLATAGGESVQYGRLGAS
jgi:hypothetical protein